MAQSSVIGQGLGVIVGTVVGIVFITATSFLLSLVLLILVVLKKFVFSKSKAYVLIVRIVALFVLLMSTSFVVNILSIATKNSGLVIIPLVPTLISVYCLVSQK